MSKTFNLHFQSCMIILTEIATRITNRINYAMTHLRDQLVNAYLFGKPGLVSFDCFDDETSLTPDGVLHYRLRTEQGIKILKVHFRIENRLLIKRYGISSKVAFMIKDRALSEGYSAIWITDIDGRMSHLDVDTQQEISTRVPITPYQFTDTSDTCSEYKLAHIVGLSRRVK